MRVRRTPNGDVDRTAKLKALLCRRNLRPEPPPFGGIGVGKVELAKHSRRHRDVELAAPAIWMQMIVAPRRIAGRVHVGARELPLVQDVVVSAAPDAVRIPAPRGEAAAAGEAGERCAGKNAVFAALVRRDSAPRADPVVSPALVDGDSPNVDVVCEKGTEGGTSAPAGESSGGCGVQSDTIGGLTMWNRAQMRGGGYSLGG